LHGGDESEVLLFFDEVPMAEDRVIHPGRPQQRLLLKSFLNMEVMGRKRNKMGTPTFSDVEVFVQIDLLGLRLCLGGNIGLCLTNSAV